MIRKFIPLDGLEIYDEFHFKSGDSFEVNVQLDGNTTEYHKEGIQVVKKALQDGLKVRPILVYEKEDKHLLLDGFKRSMAHMELDYNNIEAFVCTYEEYLERKEMDNGMRAYKGGQPFEKFGLFEAGADEEKILYWNNDVNGLRIERADGGYHVHWAAYGKYRLALGQEDFDELSKAIESI